MKVLVAVDESHASVAAAEAAGHLFGIDRATFLAIRVSETPGPWGAAQPYGVAVPMMAPFWVEPPPIDPHDVEHDVDDAGLPDAEVLVEAGDPVDRILAAAEEHHVDVIVVGSRQRGWLSRLLEPSVATGVMRGAGCPVLVVGEHD